MRQKLTITSHGFTVIVAGILLCGVAFAQNTATPSLEEQLEAQYKLAKLGSDAGGTSIVEQGTVLTIQKGGILGVTPATVAICPAKFQDGTLHFPNALCVAMIKNNSRSFQAGEKVYATKIEVKPKNDRVALRIVDCDSCNGTNPPTYYKSEVVFQFPKGHLRTASVPEIEDAIAQVFAIDNGDTQQNQAPQAGQSAGQQAQGGGQAADQQAPPPKTIQLGMTPEQVEAALGQPDKKVDLGAKKIYVYKDLKVTFVDGKVSDVQ